MAAKGVPEIRSGTGALRVRTRANADTSIEPDGLTRRVLLNVLEAFFRRPWLYLLPLIFMLGLGVSSVIGTTNEYRSVGAVRATSGTVLSELTNAVNQPGFGFETPATVTSRNINELLRTDDFLNLVAEKAGVASTDAQSGLLRAAIRSSAFAFADGDNLVRVGAQSSDPASAHRVADATIQSYVEYVIDQSVQDSTKAQEFIQGLVDEAQTNLDSASAALDDFLVNNPVDGDATRPVIQQVQEDRLRSDVDRAQSKLQQAQDKYDEARLATEQARTITEQRLRVVDAPQVPAAPEPRLKDAVMTVALFGVLGLMLSVGLLLVSATLDRTIRIPNDITAKYGLEVLAVVPNMRR